MSSSFFSDFSRTCSGTAPAPLAPTAPWQVYGQQQQQPNQGPAGSAPPATDPDLLDSDEDEGGSGDLGGAGDDSVDAAPPQESGGSGSSDNDDPPAATTSSAEPLRAERHRSNQLEKELRKARAQLSRFSEINPDEYARLQDAERKREEFERQVGDRERQLNEANLRRVRSVEKERDEARSQVQNLQKERLLERLFSEAEGRVGGDERGTFFDTFVTLCGGHFQLGDVDGRERLIPVDGKGQPLTADGVALCDGDYMEELRRHPVFSFLFQQRSGLYAGTVAEAGHDHSAAPNLQTLSTAELYLEAVKATTPGRLHRGADERIACPLLQKLMAWYLVFWRKRSTSTMVPAASASQARSRARAKQKRGYGANVAARRANNQDAGLISKGTWVRRRRDGSSPQFGSARSKARARRQRSSYRHWL